MTATMTTTTTTQSKSHQGEKSPDLSNVDAKERKRIQNRLAQRTYRRNQKKRMQALEQVIAQTTNVQAANIQHTKTPPPPPPPQAATTTTTSTGQDNILLFDTPTEEIMWPCSSDLSQDENIPPLEGLDQGCFDTSWEQLSPIHVSPMQLSTVPISQPSSLDTTSTSLQPALHRAAACGNESMCRMLLQNGANIGKLDSKGQTALHVAVENGGSEMIKLMLKDRDPNVKDSCGRTALFQAIQAKNESTTMLLLGSAIDVNCRDNLGEVALHVAVENGLEAIAQILLSHGADIDA